MIDRIFVFIFGLLIIAFSLWFFFGPKASEKAKLSSSGRQEIEIVVKGGYTPAIVDLSPGLPTRIRFNRQEGSDCSTRCVFPTLGISKALVYFETTTIEVP